MAESSWLQGPRWPCPVPTLRPEIWGKPGSPAYPSLPLGRKMNPGFLGRYHSVRALYCCCPGTLPESAVLVAAFDADAKSPKPLESQPQARKLEMNPE